MISAFLRIVLFLLPLAAVILWLRWRVLHARNQAELSSEFARLRKTLIILAISTLLAVLALWLTDRDIGGAHTRYVPPHSENGRVVPGHFEPIEKDPAPVKTPDQGHGSR